MTGVVPSSSSGAQRSFKCLYAALRAVVPHKCIFSRRNCSACLYPLRPHCPPSHPRRRTMRLRCKLVLLLLVSLLSGVPALAAQAGQACAARTAACPMCPHHAMAAGMSCMGSGNATLHASSVLRTGRLAEEVLPPAACRCTVQPPGAMPDRVPPQWSSLTLASSHAAQPAPWPPLARLRVLARSLAQASPVLPTAAPLPLRV